METTLHFAVDDAGGVCLWAHSTGQKAASVGSDDPRETHRPVARPAASLEDALAADHSLFAQLGGWIARPFRHRVRAGGSRDVMAMRLPGTRLAEVTDALRARIFALGQRSQRFTVITDDDLEAMIEALAEDARAVTLGSRVHLAADTWPLLLVDSHVRDLVARRLVVPELAASHEATVVRWVAADGTLGKGAASHPACAHLIDSHARRAFEAARAAQERAGELMDAEALAALDPRGAALLDALGAQEAGLPFTPPQRRLHAATLGRFVASGMGAGLVGERESELVVRVRSAHGGDVTAEDGDAGAGAAAGAATRSAGALPAEGDSELGGSALWRVEVCMREPRGAVYPLGAVTAAGDMTTAGALECAARVRSHAPVLARLASDQGGMTWTLDTRQMAIFLAEDAVDLQVAGIPVMLPRDWTKHRVSVSASVQAALAAAEGEGVEGEEKPQGPRGGSGIKDQMAAFRFQVSVGGAELSPEEIEEILEQQRELVRLRGEWVRLDPTTLKAAERFLAVFRSRAWVADSAARDFEVKKRSGLLRRRQGADMSAPDNQLGPVDGVFEMSLGDFQQLTGSRAVDGLDLEIEAITRPGAAATGIETLFGASTDLPDLPHPEGLTSTLRPYQKRGLEWLTFLDSHGLGGILADDMGLGKTMQVLALLVREREDPSNRGWGEKVGGPTLLVCPMSVLGSWQREAAKWAPGLRVHVHHGPERLHGEALWEAVHGHDLVLTTYALVTRDFEDLSAVLFHRVILDEAQHVKNASTGVTKAVRALPPGRRLALTGTPVENDLTDLHSIMQITNPGLLPASENAFKTDFATPIEEGDEAASARLSRLTQPYILRRVKTDTSIISDLPAKTEERAYVNITPEQAGLYQGLVDEMEEQLQSLHAADLKQPGRPGSTEINKRAVVSGTLMKMKQVLNHPAHYLGDGSGILDENGEHRSGKLERVDDLLAQIVANGEKALIFTQFTAFAPVMIAHWEKTFGISVPFLHGGVPKPVRDDMVHTFQNTPGEPGAMLLSLRAGGTGITLTAANHVIHLDRWWNPAVENQATDRAFRIGQKRNVSVHKLIAIGTIEEAIDATLASKLALADSTITTGESWLADLSDATRRSMFALREDGEPPPVLPGTDPRQSKRGTGQPPWAQGEGRRQPPLRGDDPGEVTGRGH